MSLRATEGSVAIRRCERSVAISSYKDEIAQPVPSKAKGSSSFLAMTRITESALYVILSLWDNANL